MTRRAAWPASGTRRAALNYAGAVSTDATNRLQYAPHGAVSAMKLGNGLWEHTDFNSRMQPTLIGLGTSSTNSGTLGLTYNYGTSNNNGNVQSIAYAGGGLSYTQSFGYDELNRLTTSAESPSSWSQTNSYDRYGNRAVVGAALSFSASNNRITTAGYAYDAAGNLTSDVAHTYGFDAENKIKTVDGVSDIYRYDGDGNRVRKNFGAGDQLRMVYSGGQLIAEYDLTNGSLKKEYVYGAKGLIATVEPSNGTRYATADHLGTPRVITNSSAGVVSRHDYMPFGEEIGTGFAGRTTGMGFSMADGVRQKFTKKERDNETGLDYFGARYYANTQGRFTGADPYDINFERQETADQEEANALFTKYIGQPQHWNHYSYALNNPLRYVDPDGRKDEEYEVVLLDKKIKVKISDKLDKDARAAIKENINAAIAKINAGKDSLTPDQVKQINKMNGIKVSPDFRSSGMNKASAVFQMTPLSVTASSSIDFIAGAILHDDGHLGQGDPEPDTEKFINNEKAASTFAAGVARKLHLEDAVIKWLDDDARTGHLLNGKLPDSRPQKRKRP